MPEDGRDARGFLTPERVRGLFDRAVVHFDARRFFEAHEDWEEIWHETEGDERTWMQGLIQLAAAFHHVLHGTPSGFVKLMRSCSERLAAVPGDTHGVDVEALRAAVAPWRAHAERVAAGAPLREGVLPPFPRVVYRPGVVPAPLAPAPAEGDAE